MSERILKLVEIDAITAHDKFFPAEYEAAGFKWNYEFDAVAVVFLFRLTMGHQHTPIRVWFRKDEVPEAEWYDHARKIAVEFAGLAS